jgi:hypothetical protein
MMHLTSDARKYGKSAAIEIADLIFKDLQGRYAQRLVTKVLHISWTTAKQLAPMLQTRSLYGIPVCIHRDDDPDFYLNWEFR